MEIFYIIIIFLQYIYSYRKSTNFIGLKRLFYLRGHAIFICRNPPFLFSKINLRIKRRIICLKKNIFM